jgi:hypothetical protein
MKEGKTLDKEAIVNALKDTTYELRSFAKQGDKPAEEKKEEKKESGK